MVPVNTRGLLEELLGQKLDMEFRSCDKMDPKNLLSPIPCLNRHSRVPVVIVA